VRNLQKQLNKEIKVNIERASKDLANEILNNNITDVDYLTGFISGHLSVSLDRTDIVSDRMEFGEIAVSENGVLGSRDHYHFYNGNEGADLLKAEFDELVENFFKDKF